MGEPFNLENKLNKQEYLRDKASEVWKDYDPLTTIVKLMHDISGSPDPGAEAWVEDLNKLKDWLMEEIEIPNGQYELTDVEADADTLKSAGMGTDEDYGSASEVL